MTDALRRPSPPASRDPALARRLALRRFAVAAAVSLSVAVAAAESFVPATVATGHATAVAQAQTHAFATVDLDWQDAARDRAVPARLYWPEGVDGRVPLVVFSHGIGGSRAGYSYLGRYFASHGIASLHVQHVGSDRSLWFGNAFTLLPRLHAAATEREALDRALDLRFALDRILEGPYAGRIDASRIVAAGHSYGANTVLLVSGASVERDHHVLDLADPRIAAAIVISAPPFYGEAHPEKILAGVRIPILQITATEDVINIPGYYSALSDRLAVFDATGSLRKTLAVFTGGSHSMFTDRAGTGGIALNPQVKSATQTLALAFIRRVFDGDEEPMREWTRAHHDLISNYVDR